MKTFWKVCCGVICVGMLGFVAVKVHITDRRLEQISRPSRLFHLQMIESSLPYVRSWEANLSPDHDRFFYVASQQALLWLGKGSSSFLFETSDKKYVVKFIQVARLQSKSSHGLLSKLFGRSKDRMEGSAVLDDICGSARLCFNDIPEETGMVYVHLNRTKAKIHGLKLIDSYGQSQRVCGDDTCFVVQKRATPMITVLAKLMDQGQIDQAKERIDQLFTLLLSLAQKGYIDGDDDLVSNNNIGYTDDRAIYLDTFHFFKSRHLDVAERMRYECRIRLLPLEQWLQLSYPELGAYYLQRRDEILKNPSL